MLADFVPEAKFSVKMFFSLFLRDLSYCNHLCGERHFQSDGLFWTECCGPSSLIRLFGGVRQKQGGEKYIISNWIYARPL